MLPQLCYPICGLLISPSNGTLPESCFARAMLRNAHIVIWFIVLLDTAKGCNKLVFFQ
jgi:hypothetical protein